MSQLVWNASAVVLINSKFEFGYKLIRSIYKRKYINNNEGTEGLRLFCCKLYEVNRQSLSISRRLNLRRICFDAIFLQLMIYISLIFLIKISKMIGTTDWMTFLYPILFFNIFYTYYNSGSFLGLAVTLIVKFTNLAKFTESKTKKSDLSKEDFIVIKKW